MAITITATATPSSWRVDLTITGLPAATASLSVLRTVGVDALPVRGASASLAGTTAYVQDWEAAIGWANSYLVTALAATGEVLESASATVAAFGRDDTCQTWVLSDPLAQGSAMLVDPLEGTDDKRVMVAPTVSSAPAGQRRGIVSMGTRQDSPLPLVLLADTPEERLKLRELITESTFLLFRSASPNHQLAPLFYGVTAAPEEAPDHARDESIWSLTLDPTTNDLDPTIYAWTYDDLTAKGQTYNQVAAAYADYNALARGDA